MTEKHKGQVALEIVKNIIIDGLAEPDTDMCQNFLEYCQGNVSQEEMEEFIFDLYCEELENKKSIRHMPKKRKVQIALMIITQIFIGQFARPNKVMCQSIIKDYAGDISRKEMEDFISKLYREELEKDLFLAFNPG